MRLISLSKSNTHDFPDDFVLAGDDGEFRQVLDHEYMEAVDTGETLLAIIVADSEDGAHALLMRYDIMDVMRGCELDEIVDEIIVSHEEATK